MHTHHTRTNRTRALSLTKPCPYITDAHIVTRKQNGAMAKPATKTPRGHEQRHMNKYMLVCQRGQAKWLTGALVWLRLDFCSFVTKTNKQYNVVSPPYRLLVKQM